MPIVFPATEFAVMYSRPVALHPQPLNRSLAHRSSDRIFGLDSLYDYA